MTLRVNVMSHKRNVTKFKDRSNGHPALFANHHPHLARNLIAMVYLPSMLYTKVTKRCSEILNFGIDFYLNISRWPSKWG